ncbi:unnamed protein product [Sphenostylis stenocarpa]|uniref:Uncharacterized protein n=1 Tax=Sphenostylis stenocarpa TaxID=92480 RepID=A0AA86SIP2_9FABA|nr:unnamed protein product [Sphenostylis stenocarpa]
MADRRSYTYDRLEVVYDPLSCIIPELSAEHKFYLYYPQCNKPIVRAYHPSG